MRMESIKTSDLDLAIETLRSCTTSLVLVKHGKTIYVSEAVGITPYVHAIQSLGNSIVGAALADKTAGRAAALLSVYAGISAAYAETISEGAIEIFALHGIPCKYGKRVLMILNRNMDAQCPFERIVSESRNPEDAFLRLAQAISVRKSSGTPA
jgi:hypothetical protein